jgi:hypothetical protein
MSTVPELGAERVAREAGMTRGALYHQFGPFVGSAAHEVRLVLRAYPVGYKMWA